MKLLVRISYLLNISSKHIQIINNIALHVDRHTLLPFDSLFTSPNPLWLLLYLLTPLFHIPLFPLDIIDFFWCPNYFQSHRLSLIFLSPLDNLSALFDTHWLTFTQMTHFDPLWSPKFAFTIPLLQLTTLHLFMALINFHFLWMT